MKLACIQFTPAFLDRDETVRRLDPWLDRAAGADLVVLPELCNSGYNFGSREEALACAERADDGPFLAHLSRRCSELGCEIATGFCERVGDELYNSAALLSARGLEGLYRKLHLFMNERDLFVPGDLGLPVFDRPYARIGMQICFDWSFPEPWRVLARSDRCAVHVMRYGDEPVWGIQAHPEVTPEQGRVLLEGFIVKAPEKAHIVRAALGGGASPTLRWAPWCTGATGFSAGATPAPWADRMLRRWRSSGPRGVPAHAPCAVPRWR